MKIVAYYRVSTKKQEVSGLGLEAQQKTVSDFAKHNKGKIIAEYTEVETGKNAQRPKLSEAISHAKLSKATLVVAKLDRLARNLAFTAALMDSGVEFVACDNPHANRLTIHILAAVAENEAVSTSRRTKDALAAAKANGTKLGSARPGHWEGREHKRGWAKGAKNSAKARTQRAHAAYAFLVPKMQEFLADALAQSKGLAAESRKAVAAVHKKHDKLIEAAEKRLSAAKGARDEAAAQKHLDSVIEERDAALTAARAIANYPIYEKIAERINEMGHETTAGMPFTGTAVWRILKRHEEAAAAPAPSRKTSKRAVAQLAGS